MSGYLDPEPATEVVPQPLKLWSVTTLMKLALGTSDGLVNWAVNTTAGAAFDRFKILSQYVEDGDRAGAIEFLRNQRWQKTGTAAARGTDLHRAAERLALGEDPQIEDDNLPYLEQYEKFLRDFQPTFLMAEAPVYNTTLGYAGTLDAVLTFPNSEKVLVADIKTTQWGPEDKTEAGKPKMRPPFSEVALQLVAYRHAEHVGLISEQRYAGGKRYYLFDPTKDHEPMVKTDGAVCVVVSPYDYTVTPIRTDVVVWQYFKFIREVARWTVEGSRIVIGPQLQPTPTGGE